MVIKTKSHPRLTHLVDTNNFYGWAIIAIYGSKLESVIQAKRLYVNNQQMCIDCLKLRSNKSEGERKKCGCDCFYVPIIKDFHF